LPAPLRALRSDVGTLLLPSPGRALALDRASWARARVGNYAEGREVSLGPIETVHRRVEPGQSTGVTEIVAPPWARPAVLSAR
jgi:hypothetical protein